jgi:hypothetical protein
MGFAPPFTGGDATLMTGAPGMKSASLFDAVTARARAAQG